MTDYAIARKIVELHEHLEESIDRVYTREEILRYIMFARQFKPKIGKVSRPLSTRERKMSFVRYKVTTLFYRKRLTFS